MSKNKPKSTIGLLKAVYRRTHYELRGEHGNRTRTRLAWIVVLTVVLPFAGPVLWDAVRHMPTALAVLVATLIMIRLVRWFLKRY